jgi:poly(3-hydroxybutyrate) depolymerase
MVLPSLSLRGRHAAGKGSNVAPSRSLSGQPLLAVLIVSLVSACATVTSGQLQPPAGDDPTSRRSELFFTIQGERRTAIVYAPAAGANLPAPAIVFFHGYTGSAADSERRHQFPRLWPEAYIIYAEGTIYDGNPAGAKGWQIRFPQVYSFCKQTKDVEYTLKILDHLHSAGRLDLARVFATGHSSGAFFVLSLMDILPERFHAFAPVGGYARMGSPPSPRNCRYGAPSLVPAPPIAAQPRPVLYVFGAQDTVFDRDVPGIPGYASRCQTSSQARDTIVQLLSRNNCGPPLCGSDGNFMSSFERQTFTPSTGRGAEVQIQLYDGTHAWPYDADGWIVEFFKKHSGLAARGGSRAPVGLTTGPRST